MQTVTKTLRLPVDLAEKGELKAAEVGQTFNELAIDALQQWVGEMLGAESEDDFLSELSRLVRSWFDSHDFPPDVTLRVVRRIRSDARLLSRYRRIAQDGRARGKLHQSIGKTVKQALNATAGRSVKVDPAVELITSYTILRPS